MIAVFLFCGVGAGLLFVLGGYLLGYSAGIRVKAQSSLFPQKPTSNICMCTHGKHAHFSGGTGGCNVLLSLKEGETERYNCACIHFVPKERTISDILKEGEML